MRLIDADELKKNSYRTEFAIPVVDVEDIDNAPTINPSLNLDNITEEDIEKFKIIWQRANSKGLLVINEERPQGEWEESHIISCGKILKMQLDVIEHKCKNCGRWSIKWARTIPDNFCSHCGADMRPKADQLRDCDNCIHHSENGCEVWECEFKKRSDL